MHALIWNSQDIFILKKTPNQGLLVWNSLYQCVDKSEIILNIHTYFFKLFFIFLWDRKMFSWRAH